MSKPLDKKAIENAANMATYTAVAVTVFGVTLACILWVPNFVFFVGMLILLPVLVLSGGWLLFAATLFAGAVVIGVWWKISGRLVKPTPTPAPAPEASVAAA